MFEREPGQNPRCPVNFGAIGTDLLKDNQDIKVRFAVRVTPGVRAVDVKPFQPCAVQLPCAGSEFGEQSRVKQRQPAGCIRHDLRFGSVLFLHRALCDAG